MGQWASFTQKKNDQSVQRCGYFHVNSVYFNVENQITKKFKTQFGSASPTGKWQIEDSRIILLHREKLN